MATEIIYKMVV